MFSRFHRRVPSTPTSPFSDQSSSWDATLPPDKQQCQHDIRRPKSSGSAGASTSATVTPTSRKSTHVATTIPDGTSTVATPSMPPLLPPIARVSSMISMSSDDTSALRDLPADTGAPLRSHSPVSPALTDAQHPSHPSIVTGGSSDFIGGVALANLRRAAVGGLLDVSDTAPAATATKPPASSNYMAASTPAPAPTREPAWVSAQESTSALAAKPAAISTPMTSVASGIPIMATTIEANGAPERRLTRSKPPPPPINTGLASSHHVVVSQAVGPDTKNAGRATSFVTPTDMQTSTVVSASAAPSGNTGYDHHGNSHGTGTTRTKKSLPFLKKNPMSSLLGRRRPAHNASVPYAAETTDAPVYAPIRGTKVHDFSAPRPRQVISHETPQTTTNTATAAIVAVAASAQALTASPIPLPSDNTSLLNPLLSSFDTRSPIHDDKNGHDQVVLDPATRLSAVLSTKVTASLPTLQTLRENRQTTFDDQKASNRPLPPESPSQEITTIRGASSIGTSSTRSRSVSADVSSLLRPSSSTATTRSRNLSLSDTSANGHVGDAIPTFTATPVSTMPKPTKSTSSRFSFIVGSAGEERMLEERHRKKQLEKQAAQPDESLDMTGTRDSRFDDFGDFDYDAMMDDDGLEERIPGVNADADDDDGSSLYEEPHAEHETSRTSYYSNNSFDVAEKPTVPIVVEDDDPDGLDPNNDQENFAGFIFQRSNPASSLVSPSSTGMTATPRDTFGRIIGFAVTDDTSPDLLGPHSAAAHSPLYTQDSTNEVSTPAKSREEEPEVIAAATGLGIVREEPQLLQQQYSGGHDDLYFDQGLADELDFGGRDESATPFDESIFDNNDTDQYGRPIPGAFAKAMVAAIEAASAKRDSDVSGQSPATRSTIDTSPGDSATVQTPEKTKRAEVELAERDSSSQEEQGKAFSSNTLASVFNPVRPKEDSLLALCRQLPPIMTDAERVAAYQAALAEATYKAAASGKFRRDSSPPSVSSDVGVESSNMTSSPPVLVGQLSSMPTHLAYAFTSQDEEDYEHGEYERGLDDDGFVQDMNDYDFDDDAIIAAANAEALANDSDGFYGQEFNFYAAPLHHHGSGPGGNLASSGAYSSIEYANGGYFVPAGVGRSTSGRVASREPNLTPITERSEYSNRNSVLSLTLPPLANGGEMRSPGLAHLALLDDGSDMSMDALKRLRNKTFGGVGNGSPVSLSSHEGSPQSAVDREGTIALGHMPHYHVRRNSNSAASLNYPLRSSSGRTSEAGSDCGSPTVTSFPSIAPLAAPSPMPLLGNTCFPPVKEEEDEATVHDADARIGNSLNGPGLWMHNPEDDGDKGQSSMIMSPTMVTSPTSMSALSPTSTTAPFHPLSSPRSATSKGHRHKGSADSISYTMEEESGETRWVMERRRLSETGEMEVLGREVVEGGRI